MLENVDSCTMKMAAMRPTREAAGALTNVRHKRRRVKLMTQVVPQYHYIAVCSDTVHQVPNAADRQVFTCKAHDKRADPGIQTKKGKNIKTPGHTILPFSPH